MKYKLLIICILFLASNIIFAISNESSDSNTNSEEIIAKRLKDEEKYVPKSGEVVYNSGRGITNAPKAVASFISQTQDGYIIENRRLRYPNRGKITPKCIVIHSTNTKTFTLAMRTMEMFGFAVHIMVDVDGRVYQLMDSLDERGWAARGMDEKAIHVEVVGNSEKSMLANKEQLKAVIQTVEWLTLKYNIPKNNYDVEKKGVFPHYQSKKRYGGIVEDDPLDPGVRYTKKVIEGIDGKFYYETKWKDRLTTKWKYIMFGKARFLHGKGFKPKNEPKKSDVKIPKDNGPSMKGHGHTDAPSPTLEIFETDKDGTIADCGRISYRNRGKIEIRGIVLHFTATDDLAFTIRVFNQRHLGPQIIVDSDGKVYQAMDALDDRAAAAVGTNDYCIQIEIIAMSEDELLKNKAQTESVIKLVKELAEKYKIPLNNYDIESNAGIFTHGQAKKKWGMSEWLYGSTFDPGERYMKVIVDGIGGTYYYDMEAFVEENKISKYFYSNVLKDNSVKSIEDMYYKEQKSIGTKLWKDRYSSDWVFFPYPWIP